MTFPEPVAEDKRRDVLWERFARIEAARLSRAYEEHEFDVPGLTDNVSIKVVVNHAVDCSCKRASGPFAVVPKVQRTAIRNPSAGPLAFRFNVDTADPVVVDECEALDWDFTEFEDLFVTNDSALPRQVRISLG